MHFKNTNLIGGAEAVFHGAQNPVGHVAVTLKKERCIHHVLQHTRARNSAVLVDMPDDKQRNLQIFADTDQHLC